MDAAGAAGACPALALEQCPPLRWEKGMHSATVTRVRVRPSLQQCEVVIMKAGETCSE